MLELSGIIEQELATLAPAAEAQPRPTPGIRPEGWHVTAIAINDRPVRGLLVQDVSGVEVFNWTTWDEEAQRAARAWGSEFADQTAEGICLSGFALGALPLLGDAFWFGFYLETRPPRDRVLRGPSRLAHGR